MIALTFAVPQESARLRLTERRATPERSGSVEARLAGVPVWVIHTGIGRLSAQQVLERFLTEHCPSLLICSGFAGGLDSDLELGDLVGATNYSSPMLLGAAGEVLPLREGALLTVDAPLESSDAKRSADGLAVDMETAAIAEICRRHAIPLLSMRVISDTLSDEIPIPLWVAYDLQKQQPRVGSVLRHLATHPGKILPFVRFVRGLNFASGLLAESLERLVPVLEATPPGNRAKAS